MTEHFKIYWLNVIKSILSEHSAIPMLRQKERELPRAGASSSGPPHSGRSGDPEAGRRPWGSPSLRSARPQLQWTYLQELASQILKLYANKMTPKEGFF